MKILAKRNLDFIKDMNFDLVRGRLVKSTHYFDDMQDKDAKLALLRALSTEPGNREDFELRSIEPYVRSMSIFKAYSDFKYQDF